MRINELVDSARESNGLVGKTLFGLTIGCEYAVEVEGASYCGTFYGIEAGKFILYSGIRHEGSSKAQFERVQISLGARPLFYPI